MLRLARDGDAIECGDIVVMPYTVPHDANEPLQIVVGDGSVRLGVLTDAGCMTGHIVERLSGCAALLLECNHDPELLRGSAYPPALKARIGGRLGHLSNGVAGDILAATVHGGLRHIVAAHLSERNNTPQLARAALAKASGAAVGDIVVADPQQGTGWLEIG